MRFYSSGLSAIRSAFAHALDEPDRVLIGLELSQC
jgi:hypothetical protein